MNEIGADYTFIYWLTFNNLFNNTEKEIILENFRKWKDYGDAGSFSVWLSEYGKCTHQEEIETIAKKIDKVELTKEEMECIRKMINLHEHV